MLSDALGELVHNDQSQNTKKEKLSYNATFALRRIATLSWSSLSENLMRDNIWYLAVQLLAKLS